jgi:hypothetical protein
MKNIKKSLIFALLIVVSNNTSVFCGETTPIIKPPTLVAESTDNGFNIKFSGELGNVYNIEYSTTPYYSDSTWGVLSHNMVGYVRLKLNSGFNLIGNQLNNGDNSIGRVLYNVPNGTIVYKFDGTSYIVNSYVDGVWDDPSMTLLVGEGFFIYVPAEITIALIGEVSQNNNKSLSGEFNLLTVPMPLEGSLSDVGGLAVNEGDVVYQWTGTEFSAKEFVDGVWYPSAPIVKVGEAFFLKGNARTYVLDNGINTNKNWKVVSSAVIWRTKNCNVPIVFGEWIGISTLMNQNVGFFRVVMF